MSDMPRLRYVAQYAPDVYEVIHPERERIGTVQKWGRGSWDAYGPDGRVLGRSLPTRAAAGDMVLGWAMVDVS